jgi:MFS family permease
VFFLNNAGRKPVLLWGNIIMSILLFCSGISIVFD